MEIVAIYCRLSDEDRNKLHKTVDSESIQNQKTLLINYANKQNWAIYNIYSDDDFSGLDSDRPEFNKMLNDAKEKKFNIILCKSQSRFTRDMEMVERYIHGKFLDWGIRFVSVTDNADSSNLGNKKARQINGLVNEWYSEDISNNIKAVFDIKQRKGDFIGSFAAYGYLKDSNNKNKLIVDEEAAGVINKIFSLYMEGNGTQHIAHILNEMRIPNPTKYKELKGLKYVNSSKKDDYGLWNKTTVKRILKNELYIGNMVQGKRKKINYKSKKLLSLTEDSWIIVENTHEAIIDKNTFYQVQSRFKSNVRSTKTGQVHILAAKVKCLKCGSIMQKVSSGKYQYLRCKLHSINKSMCTRNCVDLNNLVNAISDKMKEHLNKYINIDKAALKLQHVKETKNKQQISLRELEKITNDIEIKNNIIKNLYVDKLQGIITNDQFLELNTIFLNERSKLIERQTILKKEIELLDIKSNNLGANLELIRKHMSFKELNHTIVNEMIDYIEVGNNIIKIHWLF
ncbi:MAG: recombinase family protein [Clostridiaceae bacterium]|nr:recombinase family protein [Clostridiaceae bacterium]